MRRVPSVEAAEELARELLEPLGNRWAHTQAVAKRAAGLTHAVTPVEDRPLLVVAAWWHDLGYAPTLQETGCHQIDGGRYLAREGYLERLVALVAHHSAATCEAEERGLLAELEVWPREESPAADALWMADMTTGPGGEALSYDERLSEILARYQRTSIVGRAMLRAEPAIRAAIDRTWRRMQDASTITDDRDSEPPNRKHR
jgi:HD domain